MASSDHRSIGSAVGAFGFQLFAAARADLAADGSASNLSLSPMSVAATLALVAPGASGDAADQLADLLGSGGSAFHASLDSLTEALTDGSTGVDAATVRLANALFLQHDYPVLPDYLATVGAADAAGALGGESAPVVRHVDYRTDPDAVARAINGFVSEVTDGRIPALVADGVLDADAVLTLVNALAFKGQWSEPFDPSNTKPGPFFGVDVLSPASAEVTVDFLHGRSSWSAEGDGWVAASKRYDGGLAAEFVLPDPGRFDQVAQKLAEVFGTLDQGGRVRRPAGPLVIPALEVRDDLELDRALQRLGLTALYRQGGLLALSNDPKLVVGKTLHEVWIMMNEAGTEAAAATAMMMTRTSAPRLPAVTVVLDRPFFYRIVHEASGAVLFLGQITDPSPK